MVCIRNPRLGAVEQRGLNLWSSLSSWLSLIGKSSPVTDTVSKNKMGGSWGRIQIYIHRENKTVKNIPNMPKRGIWLKTLLALLTNCHKCAILVNRISVLVNSQHLWLSSQDLYKIKPPNILAWQGRGSWSPSLTAELSTTDGFWGRESQFSITVELALGRWTIFQ